MLETETGLKFKISGMEIQADRPEPINTTNDVFLYSGKLDPQIAVNAVIEGDYVLITDFYSTGLNLLKILKSNLKKRHTGQSFKNQRDYRSEYSKISQRFLLLVAKNKLAVKKAPEIGWLKILYLQTDEFLLPFPQVQGLNSSWQWYEKGIAIPVMDKKIHPWFGTYFPTRFEHLSLFDHWLKDYKGEKLSAIDIGIGSGVLTFQMLKHGFAKVVGTDINPNSLIGVNEYLTKNNLSAKVDLKLGSLFAKSRLKSELIVFNPPWLPAKDNPEGMDRAIYYDAGLFPDFFREAEKHLKPEGRIVIIFSNLAQITEVSDSHPIEIELSEGGRFQKEYYVQKKVKPASDKTRRNQTWRNSEMVELWVLKRKTEEQSLKI